MPTYAYRCRECSSQFEVSRPMARSAEPADCPDGHSDTIKLLTTVALTGAGASGGGAPMGRMPAPPAGGCCGGACGCG